MLEIQLTTLMSGILMEPAMASSCDEVWVSEHAAHQEEQAITIAYGTDTRVRMFQTSHVSSERLPPEETAAAAMSGT